MDKRIRLAAAGDILITKRIPEGNEGIAPIHTFMDRADIRMANLETTITDGSCFASAVSGGTWLTAEKGCLQDIKRYGFNVLGLANNHTMDYSYKGLAMTLKYVEDAGFSHAGAGQNLYEASRPALVETKSGRVGIFAVCATFDESARAGSQTERMPGRPGLNPLRFHTVYRVTEEHARALREIDKNTNVNGLRERHRAQGFLPPLPEKILEFGEGQFEVVEKAEDEGRFTYPDDRDMERILSRIQEAAYTCEAVAVLVHSHEIRGREEWEADYFLEEFARRCIDAGACAIVGSGTHQMKGIEIYKGCPIFYCLGNFIFENSFVRELPADFMEKYGLSPDSGAAVGLAARKSGAAADLHSEKEVFWSVLPYFEICGGKCVDIELLPISLGFGRPRYEKNLPYPSSKEETGEILFYLNKVCQRYRMRWKYREGKFVQDV